MDVIFHALAHVTRRQILDLVSAAPGLTVGRLAGNFDVTRIAIMNHLAVLEQAGLIVSERHGRSRQLYLNSVPLQAIHERWTTKFGRYWAGHLLHLKRAAESASPKDDSND